MRVGDWKRQVVEPSLGRHKNFERHHFVCGLVEEEEEGGHHESRSGLQAGDPGRLVGVLEVLELVVVVGCFVGVGAVVGVELDYGHSHWASC